MGHLSQSVHIREPRRRFNIFNRYLLSSIGLVYILINFSLLPRLNWRSQPATAYLLAKQQKELDTYLTKCHNFYQAPVSYDLPPSANRTNPRYNKNSGQSKAIVLQNTTLFDGHSTLDYNVDIHFNNGVITGIFPTSDELVIEEDEHITIFDLEGKFVTPGLVDMHSHHLGTPHPSFSITDDLNEIHPDSGPLTPFARALDALKPYDQSATIIASGGVTSSLILPGSANIIGGEAVAVKNVLLSGENREQVVEELLLEDGVPHQSRRRYIKIACGENPSRVYGHTRMGTAWLFRNQMSKAQEIQRQQDNWCSAAAAAYEQGDNGSIEKLIQRGLPQDLGLELLVSVLRGQVGVNIHCYEPQDMEAMIRHSEEFEFHIQAFHHALEAWRIPEMLKNAERNITIATFSHFAHYKHEAYDSNLYAGKILAEHGVSVAYKTDGSAEDFNSKFLLSQAAEGHSFGLPEEMALQSVTSTPAKSLGLDHRIGYVQAGYDADIVIWDSHPLSNGATPLQVYIDGVSTLPSDRLQESLNLSSSQKSRMHPPNAPQMRPQSEKSVQDSVREAIKVGAKIVVSGIQSVLVPFSGFDVPAHGNLTIVLERGRVVCIGLPKDCLIVANDVVHLDLKNGHIIPGLTALVHHMGLSEIEMESISGDGSVAPQPMNAKELDVTYAKHGLRIEGKDINRARLGGVTRAVVAPMISTMTENSFLQGVSTAFKTSGNQTILDGAIIKDDVALHFVIGQSGKTSSTPTISAEISRLRELLSTSHEPDTVFSRVANGSLPLVAHVLNHHDILHLIKVKRDYPEIYLVLFGATEAPLVAAQLAKEQIPVIFTGLRPMPDTWETKDVLVGPPLTVSPIKVLVDAGVNFGIAQAHWADSGIHLLAIDAGFAKRTTDLTAQQAVDLVSRKVNEILRLDKHASSQQEDFVIYESDPLEWGAAAVLTVDGSLNSIVESWPDSS
ncbi:hypothetical protein N7493_011126 [Penicillium malachiteum]|uniref:Amidohydrolase-related domain-containing protein n=1 Tax=Penicillium malachiteum TaxID=1324776 RepID=A0AAD6MQY7_9EURO|nr:hypothetical protein N7493_011126 [Penicillium malachiteum]